MQNSNFLFSISNRQVNKRLHLVLFFLLKKVYFLVIKFTLNNFYISITNIKGKSILISSGGMLGLLVSKRNSNYNLELALLRILKNSLRLNMTNFILKLDLISLKKKALFIKILKTFSIQILGVQMIFTPVFNGIRLKKKRRI